ncbi:MAG: hypothetical protein ACK45I_03205 [Bacteroidota bacterium]|jgi:hypothetical protein
MKIYTSVGQEIFPYFMQVQEGNTHIPLMLNLPSRLYMATIALNGEVVTRQFVVK